MTPLLTRRGLIAGAGYGLIAGVPLGLATFPSFRDRALGTGEALAYRAHRLIGRDALAPEYRPADLSPDFRTNGNTLPRAAAYQAQMRAGFAAWRLQIGGLVERPMQLSLDDLRSLPQRAQITRHDCVEGWSAIGKWRGVPLRDLLTQARLTDAARFIVLHCADDFGGDPYYESIDLVDAFHPQTILAHAMNDAPLSVGHGAPLRLRVERQLGYKQAKYVMAVEAVASLAGIGRGRGGYWEDNAGYDWYAGI